ncbi:hypothetical protein PAGU2595_012230 [Lysobacter xanthus]
MLSVALATVAGAGAAAEGGRWAIRGDGPSMQAVWQPPRPARRLWMRCDRGDPVLLLQIDAAGLPAGLQHVVLVADGLRIDYPVQKASLAGVPVFDSRIALDAPVLDRMLVAHRFAIDGGGRVEAVGTPGLALARLVRACRELHWPREASIDPSEAGFAKK